MTDDEDYNILKVCENIIHFSHETGTIDQNNNRVKTAQQTIEHNKLHLTNTKKTVEGISVYLCKNTRGDKIKCDEQKQKAMDGEMCVDGDAGAGGPATETGAQILRARKGQTLV